MISYFQEHENLRNQKLIHTMSSRKLNNVYNPVATINNKTGQKVKMM